MQNHKIIHVPGAVVKRLVIAYTVSGPLAFYGGSGAINAQTGASFNLKKWLEDRDPVSAEFTFIYEKRFLSHYLGVVKAF